MSLVIHYTVRLVKAGRNAYARKWNFLGFFAVVFLVSVAILGSLDLLPTTSSVSVAPNVIWSERSSVETVADAEVSIPETATEIKIPKIDLSATIANPMATDIAVLDEALLAGAVHYPTSAKLGEAGNVVLFGHSSYLPVVKNPAYKTFNGIQKLVGGDRITVYSDTTAYTYAVRNVVKESASDNSAIALFVGGKVLTLVTCNSFGTKEDRFVVTADFVESQPISS